MNETKFKVGQAVVARGGPGFGDRVAVVKQVLNRRSTTEPQAYMIAFPLEGEFDLAAESSLVAALEYES